MNRSNTMPVQPAVGPRLSIVIPAVTDSAQLEETLVSVLENRPHDCEIVVPLGCRYDDPWSICDEVRFVPAPRDSGLVSCTNLGLASARAPIVHVLAAGWRATPGWTDAAMQRIAAGDVAAVVPVAVAAEDRQRIVSAGIRVTRGGRRIDIAARKTEVDVAAVRPSGPCLEAGFWRSDVLVALGPGFSNSCGETHADADMAAAVAAIGATVALEPESRVVAGPARPRPHAFLEGLRAERVFWRSLAGGSVVSRLAVHGVEVARHAGVRLPLGTVPMLAGRLLAAVQFGESFRRFRELRAVMRGNVAVAGGAGQGMLRDQEPGDSVTVRIDGPHAAVSRPRGSHEGAVPLRQSA
jgi:hypothetical protein